MDTTKITSAPTECQFHNNCGGWCESPREAAHNLCADCLEAHDDDLSKGNVDSSKAVSEHLPLGLPTEQHHGEPVTLPVCKAKLTMSHDWDQGYSEGWSDYHAEIAKLGPLYTRPVQGEPVAEVEIGFNRFNDTGEGLFVKWLLPDGAPLPEGTKLYTHADPAEVERLRAELGELWRATKLLMQVTPRNKGSKADKAEAGAIIEGLAKA